MKKPEQGNVKHEPLFSPLAAALKASLMLGVTLSSVAIVIRSAKDSSIRSFKQQKRIIIFVSHSACQEIPGLIMSLLECFVVEII